MGILDAPVKALQHHAISLLGLNLALEQYDTRLEYEGDDAWMVVSTSNKFTLEESIEFFVRVQEAYGTSLNTPADAALTQPREGKPVYLVRASLDQETLEISKELAAKLPMLATYSQLQVVPV